MRCLGTPLTGVAGHRCILGSLWARSGRAAEGLVVAAGVEGEFAEEFAVLGVDDSDVEVVDEHDDGGSGVVRPMRMWWSRPATRRVSLPSVSVLRLPMVGVALGRAW